MTAKTLLFIAAGGAIGSVCRFIVAGWGHGLTGGGFPLGTVLVNVLGCLALGFLATLFAGPWLVREEYRLGLLVGLLGGFTTFSSFGYETFALMHEHDWRAALGHVVANNALGLLATAFGVWLALLWEGT